MAEGLTSAERDRVVAAARRAAQHSAWYADRLAACGFAESHTFDNVPVLTEADFAAGYYRAPERAADAHGNAAFTTSGTTSGVGRRVDWPLADHQRYVEQRAALFRSLMADSCGTAVADLGTGHAQASAVEIFASLGLEGHEIDVSTPIDGHVRALREWQPDLLYTMPVILERIVGAGGPGYVPRWIVVLGDMAPRPWRTAMAKRLGMAAGRIVDVFGSIEVGAIAYSDDEHERYLFHEHIVPEAIASPTSRSDGGQLLVLTSTERDGFPAVRYVASDIVSGLRPVELDGRRRWAFDAHLGREGTMIKHGEALSLPLMTERIAAVAPGVAWSVRREGLEAIIEIDAQAYSPDLADAVRRAVREAHPEVEVMIASGLIGDLRVEPRAFATAGAKRSIR